MISNVLGHFAYVYLHKYMCVVSKLSQYWNQKSGEWTEKNHSSAGNFLSLLWLKASGGGAELWRWLNFFVEVQCWRFDSEDSGGNRSPGGNVNPLIKEATAPGRGRQVPATFRCFQWVEEGWAGMFWKSGGGQQARVLLSEWPVVSSQPKGSSSPSSLQPKHHVM